MKRRADAVDTSDMLLFLAVKRLCTMLELEAEDVPDEQGKAMRVRGHSRRRVTREGGTLSILLATLRQRDSDPVRQKD